MAPRHLGELGLSIRFWAQVDKTGPEVRPGLGPCWLWTGCRIRGGYGVFSYAKGKTKTVHVLVLQAVLGRPLGEGLCALHSCDVPACLRPDHLREGTQKENAADRDSRGRAVVFKGSDHPNHKLVESEVREIIGALSAGVPMYSLAAQYGVTHGTISLIKTGKSWRHVPRC